MRISDRSKLQEWKQFSKQDDFKQTMQNMRVSTLCTLSTPHYPPFCVFFYCGLKFGITGKLHETSTSNVWQYFLHTRHASLRTNVMQSRCALICTSIHTSCHDAARSPALLHINHASPHRCYFALPHTCVATLLHAHLALPYHATLPHVLLHFSTYIVLCCRTFSCTFPHTSCIAAVRSLALPCPRMQRRCAYFALPYTHHATVPCVLLHLCRTLACTSPHTSCHAAARPLAPLHIRHATLPPAARPLALLHIRHATLPHVHLHFSTYVVFFRCMFVCFVSWYHATQDLATCPRLAMALGNSTNHNLNQLREGQVGKKKMSTATFSKSMKTKMDIQKF